MSVVWTCLAVILVFCIALGSRLAMVGLPPIYDELYQMLPALSWQAHQDYSLLDGIYDRAWRYTQLISLSFELAGDQTMAAARFLPSAVPGALLVAIVFLWARLVVGWTAAVAAAFFLVFWPNGIEVSQYLRFYSLQGVVFVIGALLVYLGLTRDTGRAPRLACLLLALPFFAFAVHLQKMTFLGIAAILLWAVLVPGWGWLRHRTDRGRILMVLGVACLAAAATILILFQDSLADLWRLYRWEPWPAHDDRTFYHRHFRDNYPTMWPLFPLAAVIALRVRFVPASFCILLFTVTFFLQSFGGLKNIRYLYPTMPFFFVTWGIVLQAGLVPALGYLRRTAQQLLPDTLPVRGRDMVVFSILGLCVLWLIAANAAFERSTRLMVGAEQQMLLGKRRWAWKEAEEFTRPWLEDGAVIVSTEELLALSWLGDYDLGYNRPRFSEMQFVLGPETPPFTIDFRLGRPVIGDLASLQRVMSCHPVGIVLSNAPWVDGENARRVAQMAAALGAEVVSRQGSDMSMIGWRSVPTDIASEECEDLAGLSGAAERILSGASRPQLPASARLDR